MPTTLTGLLLFVVLLLPGFAYLVGKERHGGSRQLSAFRETVSIVAASVTSELAVLILTTPIWAGILDVETVTEEEPVTLVLWGTGLLLLSTLGAYVSTWPRTRQGPTRWPLVSKPAKWIEGHAPAKWLTDGRHRTYPHPTEQSMWWRLFWDRPSEIAEAHKIKTKPLVRAGCILADGSMVEGTVADFNRAVDDNPDRDLILIAPIKYVPPTGREQTLRSQAACLAARDIKTLLVRYCAESSPVLPLDAGELSGSGERSGS